MIKYDYSKIRRDNFRQKKYDFHHNTGVLHGVCLSSVLLIIMGAMNPQQYLWVVPAALILNLLVFFNILPIRRITMHHIKKYLGINVIEMKMAALANYIKVNFIHVPEHYQCEAKEAE